MADNYTDQYIEQTFFLWHKGGRKISQRFANSLPEDEKGQRPSFKTIEKWRDSFGWIDRADALDAEISRALQDQVINERIEMYRKHEKVADKLLEIGRDFLETIDPKEIEMSDALKAIAMAVELQRVTVGQVGMGQKILNMSSDQLNKELIKLLGGEKQDEFIDADFSSDDLEE